MYELSIYIRLVQMYNSTVPCNMFKATGQKGLYMIGTMNDALRTVRDMNTKEINSLVYWPEYEGWYRENKRKTRSFCTEVIIFNWNYDRSAILRAIYNAKED